MMHEPRQKIHTLLNLSSPTRAETGQRGEILAAEHLRRRGLRIVCVNFKTPIGRNRKGVAVTGEIDIIALDESTLVFIEVKTRSSDDFASPLTAIDLRKQRQIIRTARAYREIFNVRHLEFRYDAVAVVTGKSGEPTIEWVKGFWNEARFTKRRWIE